jgi:hypothetical protein
VILVFNTAYGKLEDLPFDLRMRRVMPYNMPDTVQERSTERRALESKLNDAIRAALDSLKPAPMVSMPSEAIESVEKLTGNRVIVVRRFLSELHARIEAKRPKAIGKGATAQDLLDAIESTVNIATDYTRLASSVAKMGDRETAMVLYRSFGPLLEGYDVPGEFSGTIYPADFDVVKFVGHELFTTLLACLIRDGQWELISKLLEQGIPVKYSRREQGPANCSFDEMSEQLEFLRSLNQERRRLCVHADVLKTLHEQDPLGVLMPFEDFIAADYFLFLRGELPPDEPPTFPAWRPWSSVFMKHAPRFILDARQAAAAQQIAAALCASDVVTLKGKLRERAGRLSLMWRGGFGISLSVQGTLTEYERREDSSFRCAGVPRTMFLVPMWSNEFERRAGGMLRRNVRERLAMRIVRGELHVAETTGRPARSNANFTPAESRGRLAVARLRSFAYSVTNLA